MAVNWFQRSFSLLDYDVLWENRFRDRVPKPRVLDCESPGATYAERSRHVYDTRVRLGLGPVPEPRMLDTLAEPDEEYTMRWDSAQPFRLLAARRENLYVVAGIWDMPAPREGEPPVPAFYIGWGTPGGLPQDLLALLPPSQAAKLRSQSVRLSSLVRVGGEVRRRPAQAQDQPLTFYQGELRALGESSDASTAFARLAAATTTGRGELAMAVGSVAGRRTTGHKLVVNDIGGERYLVVTKDSYVTARGAATTTLLEELRIESKILNRQST
jgi:hypothetical protein